MLDVYQEWRQRQLKEANVLPKGVYIESEVVRAGPKGNFEEDEEDNPKGLVTNFVREFLDGVKATVKGEMDDGNVIVQFAADEYLKGIPEAYLTKEGSNQTVAKVPRSMVHSVEHTIDVGSVVTIDWKNVLLLGATRVLQLKSNKAECNQMCLYTEGQIQYDFTTLPTL